MKFEFKPIGVVRSCFSEKFGAPRQPGLVPEAKAQISLLPPFDAEEAVRGLSDFSHVWIVFVFHRNREARWSPTVRPPRLGGNRRIGVFASRSGFRPNPIGLSAVRLEGIEQESGACRLLVSGVDLVDGTPVLDIKPYVPYADRISGAMGGYAREAPERRLQVVFSDEAARALETIEAAKGLRLRRLIEGVLALDPRPAYRRDPSDRMYAFRLCKLEIRWQAPGDNMARVLSVGPACDPFDQKPDNR